MPRLIDADALIAEWCDGCKYLINGMCDQDICGGVELIKDAPTIDPESLAEHLRLLGYEVNKCSK